MRRKARYLIGGDRQRYLFRGRFLCKHFSILSLFSHASGLAETGRATGIPSCCAQPSPVEVDAPPGSSLPPLCVYQPKSERACRSCSLCCHPVCLYNLCACQHCSHHLLPPINKPTNQPDTILHSTQTSTPHPPRLSNPRSRTLGSETRHPRTDKPARVARCVAPPCAALFCICSNGHLTPAYIHLLATNNCSTIARSLPYMQLLLPLTKVAR